MELKKVNFRTIFGVVLGSQIAPKLVRNGSKRRSKAHSHSYHIHLEFCIKTCHSYKKRSFSHCKTKRSEVGQISPVEILTRKWPPNMSENYIKMEPKNVIFRTILGAVLGPQIDSKIG